MEKVLTDKDKQALLNMVWERMHLDLIDGCDCPLHKLSKEERAELIDRTIDLTDEQVRNGEIPGFRFTEGRKG